MHRGSALQPHRRQSAAGTVGALTRRTVLSKLSGIAVSAAQRPARHPNVLLVISDQLHHGAMGAARNRVIQTPNIDRLAREGARFESAL